MSNTSREIHENNTKYIILNNKGNIESNHSPEVRNNVICMSEHVTMIGVNMNTAISAYMALEKQISTTCRST